MIISNLKKQIGELTIDIPHFELSKGKIHGLFGGNGSGKSTLSKLIINALPLDSGTIDYSNICDSHSITLMPQRPYLLQRSVYDNIVYPLQIRNIPVDETEIDAHLNRAGLLHKRNTYARSLSSGEQQKVSFIRALIFKPKFIIIDETLSNLDIDSLNIFLEWILDWQAQHKATWLIISHQVGHMRKLCDEVHCIVKGRIQKSGTVDDIMEDFNTTEILTAS